MEMKQCSKCKEIKPISEFGRCKTSRGGYYPSCRACRKKYYEATDQRGKAREKYRQNPEKAREHTRQYYRAHPEKYKEYRAKYFAKYREKFREVAANLRQRYRDDAFNAYGGYICACCGETIPQFLTIDHMDGTAKEARKTQKSGWVFYRQLKMQGYPSGYQVLCYNCNCGRARNNGICPHKSLP